MIIKELKEVIENLDDNMIVVLSNQEDNYEPGIILDSTTYELTYYTGREFLTIPANTKFLRLS